MSKPNTNIHSVLVSVFLSITTAMPNKSQLPFLRSSWVLIKNVPFFFLVPSSQKICTIPSNTSVFPCVFDVNAFCSRKGCYLLPKVLNVLNIYVQTFAILLYFMPNEMRVKSSCRFATFDELFL